MSTAFEKYSDILFDAYLSSDNNINKKQILPDILSPLDGDRKSILFVGFSEWIFEFSTATITITSINEYIREWLLIKGVKFTYKSMDDLLAEKVKFDTVIAIDEYFTFAVSDRIQREQVEELCKLSRNTILTTLRDYKNQDYKSRDFSFPLVIESDASKKIFFEHYEYDQQDRNAAVGTNYIISDDGATVIGPFERRNMYFKQLAKFSLDAGATSFLVHKNVMYKSLIKKTYEHIITIKL